MVKGSILPWSRGQGALAGTKMDDPIFLTRADTLTKWGRSFQVVRLINHSCVWLTVFCGRAAVPASIARSTGTVQHETQTPYRVRGRF